MPGFTTHYLFGTDAFHELKCAPLKRNLYYNRAAYALGLQGPDLFFYYLPSYAFLWGHNLGALAHDQRTGEFFQNLLESRYLFTSLADRRIAEAYLFGFLGHYTLDTVCHPFIYARTDYHGELKGYYAKHAYLETEIDTDLLALKQNRKPSEFHQNHTLALSLQQRIVIARMLQFAYTRTYPEFKSRLITMLLGIFSMRLGVCLLHDKTGQKKVLARLAEKYFLGFPHFSPLIASDKLHFCKDPFNMKHRKWANPWNPSLVSDESFFDLYEKAGVLYQKRIRMLYRYLRLPENSHEAEVCLQEFRKEYGNLSFASGLDSKKFTNLP
ncbi:MAG: zinc dependent phospholipase C family protein [Roseburia sp.]